MKTLSLKKLPAHNKFEKNLLYKIPSKMTLTFEETHEKSDKKEILYIYYGLLPAIEKAYSK